MEHSKQLYPLFARFLDSLPVFIGINPHDDATYTATPILSHPTLLGIAGDRRLPEID
jgi:hypothetical protein